jgi:hypothetical protein
MFIFFERASRLRTGRVAKAILSVPRTEARRCARQLRVDKKRAIRRPAADRRTTSRPIAAVEHSWLSDGRMTSQSSDGNAVDLPDICLRFAGEGDDGASALTTSATV